MISSNVTSFQYSGIRKIRLHDLRHTFGSLLLETGASIVYVKEQMGLTPSNVAADTYGHLVPGAKVAYVDHVDLPLIHAASRIPPTE